MAKVKFEKGQILNDISVHFAGQTRTLIYPGKTQMLDIQGSVQEDIALGNMARVCAAAIGLCLDQSTGFTIKTDAKRYKFKFLEYGEAVLEELFNRDIEANEIIKVGTQIITQISGLFKEGVKKTENFSEAP